MPLYLFEGPEGLEEHYLSMSEAPRLGDTAEIDGRTLRRIVAAPRTQVKADRHFVAWSQKTEGMLGPGDPRAPRYDRDPSSPSYGHGLFNSQREVDEYVAKSEGGVIYD